MAMAGSLAYPQSKTKPDISFPLSLISRFMQNPTQHHMDALTKIYAYPNDNRTGLYHKSSAALDISTEDQEIQGFVDSDWGGCKDTGKSTTGWVWYSNYQSPDLLDIPKTKNCLRILNRSRIYCSFRCMQRGYMAQGLY
jgi:hypothetical protein